MCVELGDAWTCPDPSLSCLYRDGNNCWRRPNSFQTLYIGDTHSPPQDPLLVWASMVAWPLWSLCSEPGLASLQPQV